MDDRFGTDPWIWIPLLVDGEQEERNFLFPIKFEFNFIRHKAT